MAATHIRITKIEDLAPTGAMADPPDAVVFEGVEAAAFVAALDSGTASAAYLCEADEVFARLYVSEPVNRLVR